MVTQPFTPISATATPWQRLQAYIQRITTPHPALQDVEGRRKARLQAYMSLALAFILTLAGFISIFTSVFFPDPSISLGLPGTLLIFVTAGGFWNTYYLSRQPRYEGGAWLTVATIYIFLTCFIPLYPVASSSFPLGYGVPVLIATIFLRSWGTVRVFAFSFVLSIVVLALTATNVVAFAVAFAIILVVTLLTVLVALLREQDLAEVRRLREQEAEEAERLRDELELARKVQLAMLPTELPQLANVEVAAYSQPALEASGDFYDLFLLNNGSRLGIVVCDVAGKGVSSALIMSATRAALRAESDRTSSPAEVLRKVNDVLAASVPAGLFATLFYGIYDPATRELRFASGGHPHPYLWTGESTQELQSFGMPLGLVAESEYEESVVLLAPGQSILIYTDGLVEALNARREMYGFEQVEAKLGQHARRDSHAQALISATLSDMERFVAGEKQHDDVTLVALHIQ